MKLAEQNYADCPPSCIIRSRERSLLVQCPCEDARDRLVRLRARNHGVWACYALPICELNSTMALIASVKRIEN